MAIGPTEGLPSLVLSAVARVVDRAAAGAVVGLVMWTWTEAPAARDAGPKPSTPPAIVQPGLEPAASMLQARPGGVVGRVSLTVSAGDRAGAVVGDGDDVADRAAGADARGVGGLGDGEVAAVDGDRRPGPPVGLPSLVLTRLALLLYVAQLVEVVAAVTWTTRLWPAASVIGWPARLSTWLPGPPVRLKLAGLPCRAVDHPGDGRGGVAAGQAVGEARRRWRCRRRCC